MDSKQRQSDLDFMAVTAGMVKIVLESGYAIGIGHYTDPSGNLVIAVHLNEKGWEKYFAGCAYRTRYFPTYNEKWTEYNGLGFFCLFDNLITDEEGTDESPAS